MKNMKATLSPAQTTEQLQVNEQLRFNFILAVTGMDERLLLPLLKEDGIFMSKLNRWQMMKWFRSIFAKVTFQMFNVEHHSGISLEEYPGAEVHEFVFQEMLFPEESEDGIFLPPSSASSEDQVIIRLVLTYDSGKIADIRRVHKFLPLEQIKKMQKDN